MQDAYIGAIQSEGAVTMTEKAARAPGKSTWLKSAWVVIAAAVPVGLYLLFVYRYSVNVPYTDDWYLIPLVHSALHGQLSMSQLWAEFSDTRFFVPNLVFVAFAFIDHFNIKSILLFSAVLFVASYVLLLSALRAYLAKRLTFFPVFVVGIVWFSLEDVQNALWGLQLAWYLCTFFFVATIYFLLVPRHHRTIFVGLGIVAAIAGSYSIFQGFLIWPVGLICLLWNTPWGRRVYYEALTWVAAAAITVAVYLPGYRSGYNASSVPFALSHPVLLLKCFALLVGNLVPAPWSLVHATPGAHEVLGTAILAVAGFAVVQTLRERGKQVNPLPLLLVVFGMLFDFSIALGRVEGGVDQAALQSRYTMPSLILLVGIVIYVCGQLPRLRGLQRPIDWRGRLKVVGLVTFGAFLLVQCVTATDFGIVNGRATHETHETDARIVVNFHRIPPAKQGCEVATAVWQLLLRPSVALITLDPYRRWAAQDYLSVFQPSTGRVYRAEGPPTQREIDTAGHLKGVQGPSCS